MDVCSTVPGQGWPGVADVPGWGKFMGLPSLPWGSGASRDGEVIPWEWQAAMGEVECAIHPWEREKHG